MSMTRTDFELLARGLKAMYPTQRSDEPASDVHYRDGYNAALNQVAGTCSSSNARFDADKFKAACGHAKAELPKMPAKGPPITWKTG